MEPIHIGQFHNAETGETTSRQLTPEEIAFLLIEETPTEASNGD